MPPVLWSLRYNGSGRSRSFGDGPLESSSDGELGHDVYEQGGGSGDGVDAAPSLSCLHGWTHCLAAGGGSGSFQSSARMLSLWARVRATLATNY